MARRIAAAATKAVTRFTANQLTMPADIHPSRGDERPTMRLWRTTRFAPRTTLSGAATYNRLSHSWPLTSTGADGGAGVSGAPGLPDTGRSRPVRSSWQRLKTTGDRARPTGTWTMCAESAIEWPSPSPGAHRMGHARDGRSYSRCGAERSLPWRTTQGRSVRCGQFAPE
jgi:hypothetical protein